MSKFFALLLSAILMLSSVSSWAESPSTSLHLEPQAALGAYKGLVEDHLSGVLRTERVLALTSEARSARWEAVRPLLERFRNDLTTDATVWFMLPDGSYYLTDTGQLSPQNLKDRAYFPRLMAGKDVLGDLVISKSTGYRSVVVATPVMVNGAVVAAIGVSVRLRLLSELVEASMKLPRNAYFYAIDHDTKIALHRNVERMFKTVSEVGDESLGEAFRAIMKNDQGAMNYTLNGKKMHSIFQKSSILGWYFFIAQESQGVIDEPKVIKPSKRKKR